MCTSDSEAVINELESTDDQIELHNAGAQMLDISGWILTDEVVDQDYDPALDAEKLVFPPDSALAAGEFLIVAKGDLPGQHPFGLSGDGDTVTLMMPDLAVVDQVSYGVGAASISYCRLPDGPGGQWTADCLPTLGLSNKAP